MSQQPRQDLMTEDEIQEQLVPLGAPFALTEHGLSAPFGPRPTIEQCAAAAMKLKRIHGALAYWIGDFAELVETLHGEEASQIIDPEFLDEKTLSDYRFVAKSVGVPIRRMAPSWDHSKAVARLPPAKQEKWMQQSLDQDWIASKLKAEISADGAGGSTAMRFLIIVDAKTEAKQKELAKKLESEGFVCTLRSGLKKEAKAKKAKGGGRKKGEVTARKRRGAPKMYTRRRTPK